MGVDKAYNQYAAYVAAFMVKQLAKIDRDLIAPSGLLRAGIAWKQDTMGDEFRGARPGIIAHDIGDNPGRERGAIAITQVVYDRLSPKYQGEFRKTGEDSPQGRIFVRYWNPNPDRDLG